MKKIGSLILILCLILNLTQSVCADSGSENTSDSVVGIVTKTFSNNYKLKSGGREYSIRVGQELCPGDILIKKANEKAPEVIWWINAGWKDPNNKTRLEVIWKQPADNPTWIKATMNYIAKATKFIETTYKSVTLGSKGPDEIQREDEEKYIPRPGYNITAIPGQAINFAWDKKLGEAKAIVFKDSKDNVIFRKATRNFISLTPEQIKMKAGMVYTWEIEGVKMEGIHKIRLLPDKNVKQIADDFKRIDKQKISENMKKINKAIYLQIVSDIDPSKEIDLYWLSYEYIKKIDISKSDKRTLTLVEGVKDRFYRHLNDTCLVE